MVEDRLFAISLPLWHSHEANSEDNNQEIMWSYVYMFNSDQALELFMSSFRLQLHTVYLKSGRNCQYLRIADS